MLMRIAYVFDPLLPLRDTDTEQVMNTVSALLRRGAEVELVLPRSSLRPGVSEAELGDFYKVDPTPRVRHLRSLFPSYRPLEKLAHAVRAASYRPLRQFDIVYTRNVSGMVAALAWRHPLVYETYRPWADQYPALAPLFRTAMARHNFVGGVLHSAYARQKYIDIGVDPNRLEVVHNGYEPRLFSPRLSRAEARRAIALDDDRPLLLYAGRVNLAKGLGIVLELADRHRDVAFALVGSEGHGEVEERAARMDNVHVFPWTPYDRLPEYLFAADILIIPPSMRGLEVGNTVLPMKLFLYLAAARPILAPRSPDTAELLSHDENSYLVSPDDLEAASVGLRTLVDDRGLADRLGRTAGELAADLTWDARAEKILAFIDRRLGS
jgi:glycosyltransferase involved in cell wall biosynthesis